MNVKKFNKKGNEQFKVLLQSTLSKDTVSNIDYQNFDQLLKNRNLTEEIACAKKLKLKILITDLN